MIICQYCDGQYKSYKSWHRHKTLKHKNEITPTNRRLEKHTLKYNDNPKRCKQCTAVLSYEKRRNDFCNSNCSGTFTNAARDQEAASVKVRTTWRKKLGEIHYDNRLEFQVRKCICGNIFTPLGSLQRFCRPSCNTSKIGKIRYRTLCKFALNNKDHKYLFNAKVLKDGWYAASNKGHYNPDGACWDHLYRIEEGFANNIDPTIMSHPANAELVPWRVNVARKHSMITLNQLFERIALWDSQRQPELVYFLQL